MRLYCLGLNPQSSCIVVKFNNLNIMFDCGIEFSSFLNFLPNSPIPPININETIQGENKESSPFKHIGSEVFIDGTIRHHLPQLDLVNINTIDIILISNMYNMMGLPYVTERTAFKGKIFATEPTLQIGRSLMLDLVTYHNMCVHNDGDEWASMLSHMTGPLQSSWNWKKSFTVQELEKCIAKIKPISYLEETEVWNQVCITPLSSGYCLGSSNWLLKTKYEKLVYISDSSPPSNRHPEQMDISRLHNADVLILSNLTPFPAVQTEQIVTEICNVLGNTLKENGVVLIPSYSCGVILDLLEYVHQYLASVGLQQIPIYFVSPTGEHILGYVDIISEWLNKGKQERAFVPESPFLHSLMIKNGSLIQLQNIYSDANITTPLKNKMKVNHAIKEPCIIFAGHPSCRLGDITHLISLYGNNPKNSIILIEPAFDREMALAPFQPLSMRSYFFPLDPRLSFSDANQLLPELKPKHLAIPVNYLSNPNPSKTNSIVTDIPTSTFKHHSTIKLPLVHKYKSGNISQFLATFIQPLPLPPLPNVTASYSIDTIETILDTWNHRYEMNTPTLSDLIRLSTYATHGEGVLGDHKLDDLLLALYQIGIKNVGVQSCKDKDDKSGSYEVIIEKSAQGCSAKIKIAPNETTIETEDETFRRTLTDLIIKICSPKIEK